ncbi:papain family cysteine protease [Necator americanus]|uniref:Papain family cysteine protease n=1 Tax=Necator americanus TaxID=51031 RepID=W2SLA9_NECAM|nr:papain family cysteine protease [Necator americanus]ETN70308.1 papain family cysteine protease [Necator americanus]
MWPKLTAKKPTNTDFIPVERSERGDDLGEERHQFLHRLANIVAVLTHCLLVASIILLLVKLSSTSDNTDYEAENSYLPEIFEFSETRYAAMFEEFIQSYNKVYADENEKNFRFTVFVKNVVYFEEEERNHPGLDLDVTRFADWTEEEMRKFLSSDLREVNNEEHGSEGTKPYEKVQRPVSVDWVSAGKVIDVKDQGQCGSCWAFATVASVEAAYAIKTGQLTRLSEQELVDCDSRNNGCNGGYRPYAMSYNKVYADENERNFRFTVFVKNVVYFEEEERNHPGLDLDVTRFADWTEEEMRKERVYIRSYRTLSSNEDAVADWIAANGPVTFGMNVTKSLYSYRSGIFSPSKEDCEEHSLGSHALTFVGYGTEGGQPYWLVKNSWGSRWGQNGYFKMARGGNICGAANNVVGPML